MYSAPCPCCAKLSVYIKCINYAAFYLLIYVCPAPSEKFALIPPLRPKNVKCIKYVTRPWRVCMYLYISVHIFYIILVPCTLFGFISYAFVVDDFSTDFHATSTVFAHLPCDVLMMMSSRFQFWVICFASSGLARFGKPPLFPPIFFCLFRQ